VDDWRDQGYLPENVNNCLLDPNDDTLGVALDSGTATARVDNGIVVVEQQDLKFSEAIERIARTTIAEQTAVEAGGIPSCAVYPLNNIAVGRNPGKVTQLVERMEVREGRVRVCEGR
jgi:hypothetical protein